MILEDLVFEPFKTCCPKCEEFILVELEDLRLNNEIHCPKCGTRFFPNINSEMLLNLIKKVESPNVLKTFDNGE